MHILELSTPGLLLLSAFHSSHSARPRALRLWLCGSGFYSLPKLWISSTSNPSLSLHVSFVILSLYLPLLNYTRPLLPPFIPFILLLCISTSA